MWQGPCTGFFFETTPDTKCVLFLYTPTISIYGTNWVLNSSIQLWYGLPRVRVRSYQLKGSIPQDWPHFRHQLQMGYPGYPHFWPQMWEFPWAPLRFDNLLKWLTELRKTLYLSWLVHWKGYNPGTAKWKKCIGQVMGDESGGGDWYRSFVLFPVLPPSQHQNGPTKLGAH